MSIFRKLRRTEKPAAEAPRKKVLVAVLNETGYAAAPMTDLMMTIVGTIAAKTFPWDVSLHVVRGQRPVHRARNMAVRAAIDGKYDKLLFLDDDQSPTPAVFRLIEADADIAVGWTLVVNEAKGAPEAGMAELLPNIYRKKDEQASAFVPILDAPFGRDQLIDVDAAGTALMCIDRKVLEDRRLWAEETFYDPRSGQPETLDYTDPDVGYPLFTTHYRPDGKVLRSEDISFSWRAKQLGYRVCCNLAVQAGHVKRVDLLAMARMTSAAVVRAAGKETAA